ncbi:MAG: hypothetical protein AAF226_14680 [Verrucomicrobiota bacterium]
MKSVCLILFLTALFCNPSLAGEVLKVNGTTYRNAEVIEVTKSGPIYKTEDETIVPLEWAELTPQQLHNLRTKNKESLMNVILGAKYARGTVFQANKDGVIIQITLENEENKIGTEGFLNGAEIVKGGLVIVPDLPSDVPRGTGVEVKFVGYQIKEYDYDLVVGQTKVPYLTHAKPDWAKEREWTNIKGQTMTSSLVAVKAGKGLFEKADGTRFPPIELKTLDAESQKIAAIFAEKVKGYPIP